MEFMIQTNQQQCNVHLQELQQLLKDFQLWSDMPPSEAAMKSTSPFAYDAMPLEQWLQFIFIPRMQTLLTSDKPLPANMAISPVAELRFYPHTHQSLITKIKQLDNLFSAPASAS